MYINLKSIRISNHLTLEINVVKTNNFSYSTCWRVWMELWQVFFDRCEISAFETWTDLLRKFWIWCRVLVTLAMFSKQLLDSNFRSFDKIEIEDAASLQPSFWRSKLFSCFIMWSCNQMYCDSFYMRLGK